MADTLSLKQALYMFFVGVMDKTISDDELTGDLIKSKLGYDPAQKDDISGGISSHNVSAEAHSDIRELINSVQSRINAFFDTDDDTLDQLSEIVEYIKSNKTLIESVTTSKVSVDDIVDNLISTSEKKPLSANQGRVINELIDALKLVVNGKADVSEIPTIPENLSSFKNDVGYLTEHQSLDGKVDKISGKMLSSNDYTDDEKTKLSGIAEGAEANVKSDWDQENPNEDDFIKNKPASLPASDVYDWAKQESKPSYTAGEIGADPYGTAAAAIQGHNDSEVSHSDIRQLITDLADRLNTFLDSDDETLDQASEIVAYIKSNKELIDGITTSKVSVSDIVDNLTSKEINKPLSANQGYALKLLIDSLTSTVDDKASSAQGEKADTAIQTIQIGGVIQDKTEGTVNLPAYPTSLPASDVSDWAKAENKPSYTASEVGLGNVGDFKAVSTVASQGLEEVEKSNARANIDAASNKSASASAAGLMSIDDQTFSGSKTFNDAVVCNGASSVETAQSRNIYAGTEDLTAGSSALATGAIYLVYE